MTEEAKEPDRASWQRALPYAVGLLALLALCNHQRDRRERRRRSRQQSQERAETVRMGRQVTAALQARLERDHARAAVVSGSLSYRSLPGRRLQVVGQARLPADAKFPTRAFNAELDNRRGPRGSYEVISFQLLDAVRLPRLPYRFR